MVSCTTKRSWKQNYEKTTPSQTRNRIRQKIQKIIKTKEGVGTKFLKYSLKHVPHFIGVFSVDNVAQLSLNPESSFIVNLDFSTQPGSHWIAIKMTQKKCFIIDSLGGVMRYGPLNLFLTKISQHRKVIKSPAFQPKKSNLCGFYCLYFLLLLQFTTFSNLCKSFSTDLNLNDNKLLDFF